MSATSLSLANCAMITRLFCGLIILSCHAMSSSLTGEGGIRRGATNGKSWCVSRVSKNGTNPGGVSSKKPPKRLHVISIIGKERKGK